MAVSTLMRSNESGQLDQLIAEQRCIRRGDALFRAGDLFKAWYAVSMGSLKSTVASLDGHAQVTGFYVAGDLVGWDGIHTGRHSFNMVALEDTEVRVLPYGQLESAARLLPALHTDLHKTMSREIVRDHEMMLLLGSMRAEQRLAAFLLNLAQRLKTVGRVNSGFTLQMTRADIGSFLGLKLETVSRGFSRLARSGLIELDCRQVRIINSLRLRRVLQATPAR